jgi:hypothetical protein
MCSRCTRCNLVGWDSAARLFLVNMILNHFIFQYLVSHACFATLRTLHSSPHGGTTMIQKSC